MLDPGVVLRVLRTCIAFLFIFPLRSLQTWPGITLAEYTLMCVCVCMMYIMYLLQIQEAGFDILLNEERTLTEAEVQVFYQQAREVSSSASIGPPPFLLFPPPTLC